MNTNLDYESYVNTQYQNSNTKHPRISKFFVLPVLIIASAIVLGYNAGLPKPAIFQSIRINSLQANAPIPTSMGYNATEKSSAFIVSPVIAKESKGIATEKVETTVKDDSQPNTKGSKTNPSIATGTPYNTIKVNTKGIATITHHIRLIWKLENKPTIWRVFAITVPNNGKHDLVTITTNPLFANVLVKSKKYDFGTLHFQWDRTKQDALAQIDPYTLKQIGTLINGTQIYRARSADKISKYYYFSKYYKGYCKEFSYSIDITGKQTNSPVCAVLTVNYGSSEADVSELYVENTKQKMLPEYDKIVLSIIPEK